MKLPVPLARYARWLHTRWPAGRVEPLPVVADDGSTNVPGLYVTGELTGVPLLKVAVDTGARTVRTILADRGFGAARQRRPDGTLELAIVGAGVSGMSAALEAREAGLDVAVFEADRPFATILDFPRGKPIYTYPRALVPAGRMRLSAEVKEALVEELQRGAHGVHVTPGRVERIGREGDALVLRLAGGDTVRALRVIVAIGRSGSFRRLRVPGEDLEIVHRRLHDPGDHATQRAVVVGGGDTALETAIALADAGAQVTLAHRGAELARPRPENVETLERLARQGRVALRLRTRPREIRPDAVVLEGGDGEIETVPADIVFVMIGREPPLAFFRRAGVRIAGEWTWRRAAALALFLAFCVALYDWKSGGRIDGYAREAGWFPHSLASGTAPAAGSLLGVLHVSAQSPAFYYTLAYSVLVVVFGLRRIRRRRTPYVRVQTWTLMAIQVLPLFLLPEILLPWMDAQGWLPAGVADALFPRADYGHGREFWRAYGFVLAWPLNVYNVFTEHPLPWWLLISAVQTLVLIPAIVYVWGKGAYCGWICSCGALAETLGDAHRHKMPHGPGWNRLNLAGQVLLGMALVLLVLRVTGWVLAGGDAIDRAFAAALQSWKWTVDVFLAGVIGYGLYFWFSGRVWCRFFCPLAAFMHVVARVGRFRILADKKKCISCNVCTSVCHQGIDVMSFANRGAPMADPQCVRCSACVSSCPTGVLSFGQVSPRTGTVISVDRLQASLVQMREGA